MTTFDAWEAMIRPPEDYLMHFRTKGSKNGVRRYQNPDGSWTEAGLAERRKREGWGDGGDRKLRKAEKKVEKLERRQEKAAARKERRQAAAEKKRQKSLKGLTDAEMKQKLERARMEAEYRDLQKRGTLVETGANLVKGYLNYREKKEQRTLEENRQKVDMMRAKADIVRAKEGTKRAHEEYKTKKEDVKGGLKLERKSNLTRAKLDFRNTTIRGGIGKRINQWLTAGKSESYKAWRKAKSDVKIQDYLENTKNKRVSEKQKAADKQATREYNRATRRQAWNEGKAEGAYKYEQRRAARQERQRQKTQDEYEKRMKRLRQLSSA